MNKRKLIIYLDQKGWNQRKIADRVGLTYARICQILSESNDKKELPIPFCEICEAENPTRKYSIDKLEPLIICENCWFELQ